MNAPLPTSEMVISRCPNHQAIHVDVASQRALEWLRQMRCYSSGTLNLLDNPELPTSTTVLVSECYNVGQVFDFMASKPWVKKGEPLRAEPVISGAMKP